MSAKIMSSIVEDKKDLQKQIGCMNGIFQLFDRHHFITGWRISSSHKRLLPQPTQQLDTKCAKKSLMGNDTETQKEKPRTSMESSRALYSSCSSAFSSFDSNKTPKPEKLDNIPENPLHVKTIQERKPSAQSLDLRDVVKDSMYREARGLSIKSRSCDERKGHAIKRIDSPRPLPQSRPVKSKVIGYESAKHGQLALPRFSYDGRESREKIKSAKELPRFSLDSKASSMKSSIVESRLNFLGRDPLMENWNSGQCELNKELGNHNRSSSVVAKLMGLKDFSEESFISQSPHLSKDHPPSPSSRLHKVSSVTKATARSRIPMEPAPWRQQISSPGSQNLVPHGTKETKENPHLSSSVYGQIEKRITKLEFKNSGKDLRALKHVLEAMHKTRERVESQTGESAGLISQKRYALERSSSDQNSSITKKPRPPKQFGSSIVIMKPEKVVKKVEVSFSTGFPTREISCLQKLQTREPKYLNGCSAHKQEAKDLTPRKQRMVENCTTSEKNFEMVSPRLKNHLIRAESKFHPRNQSSDSGAVKKYLREELDEKGSVNRKQKVKMKNVQLSDDRLSEYSSYHGDSASVKSESNNSLDSQMETEVISLANSSRKNGGQKQKSRLISREHVPAAEPAITMEQPSPVSVLDTFYIEDSPSPVKKISTAFRDEGPIPNEAEWHLENPNLSTDRKRSNHGFEHNHKLGNMKNLMRELRFLNNEPDETDGDNNTSVHESHNPDHRYIDRILHTSRILKDANFISKDDQHFSSCHLINPEIFHVLEQQQGIMERVDGDLNGKDDWQRLNQKSQRKIVFDMVNEILVRKITSGGLFTVGRKRMSSQRLVKELYLEIDHLHEMTYCNHDEEDEEMIKILSDDLKYQSEDWEDNSREIPALVLDIERLIFKDLINEIVTSELTSLNLNDWPKRHCRQLFTK